MKCCCFRILWIFIAAAFAESQISSTNVPTQPPNASSQPSNSSLQSPPLRLQSTTHPVREGVLNSALHDKARQLWHRIKAIEENVHVASIDPKSGPSGGVVHVTATGLGFQSSTHDLDRLLSAEDFVFGLPWDAGTPLGRPSNVTNDDAPAFWYESIRFKPLDLGFLGTPQGVLLGSTLPSLRLSVHIDVIDGLYLVVSPQVTGDTNLAFTMPKEATDKTHPSLQDSEDIAKQPSSANPQPPTLPQFRPEPQKVVSYQVGTTAEQIVTQPNKRNIIRRQLSQLPPQNVTKQKTKGQHVALVSVHLFRKPILKEKISQIFRIYPAPDITHIIPPTLSLSGGEEVYLFGQNLFASDVIEVRFASMTSEKTKSQECQFVMAVPPDGLPSQSAKAPNLEGYDSQLPTSSSLIEQPAVLCSSPPWTSEDQVTLSLSFNGQQFHTARRLSDAAGITADSEPIRLSYVDQSSLLGGLAKAVVERDIDRGPKNIYKNGTGASVGASLQPDLSKAENLHILKIVDEGHSVDTVDRPFDPSLKSPFNLIDAKHLPSYFEKPKDLLLTHLEDDEQNRYVLAQPGDPQQLRSDFRLLNGLAIMIVFTAIGSCIADFLKCPVLLGQLIAGIVAGPRCLDLVSQPIQIYSIGQLGSALLLFGLGLHFSLSNVAKVRQAAIWAGVCGSWCFVIVCFSIALGRNTSQSEALILGFFVSMSSTTLCSRDIAERKASSSHEADMTVGILLIQDVLLGIVLAFLPIGKSNVTASLFSTVSAVSGPLLKMAGFAACVVVLTGLVLPRALRWVHRRGSKELLLICSFAAMLSMGSFAERLGLSLELGAFTAGLMIATQPEMVRNEVEALMNPLRDCFGGLFFGVMGLLLDLSFIWDNMNEVVMLLGMITSLKLIVFVCCLLLARYDLLTSLRVALRLAHLGEFTFVIVAKAHGVGLLGRKVHLLLLGTTGISLALASLLIRLVQLIPPGANYASPPTSQPWVDFFCCPSWLSRCDPRTRNPVFSYFARIWSYLATADYIAVSNNEVEVTSKYDHGESNGVPKLRPHGHFDRII